MPRKRRSYYGRYFSEISKYEYNGQLDDCGGNDFKTDIKEST